MATGAELKPGRYLGRALPRREDARILRGEARYVDDIELPGLAHMAFVRSPHAHARVGAVRVPEAPACSASSPRRSSPGACSPSPS